MPTIAAQRRQRIRDLVRRNEVRTQEQLLALLVAEGLSATQATLSRDLGELGVRKRSGVYCLPAGPTASASRRRRIGRELRGMIEQADRSGSLVVLRTRPGMAQAVATELERGELHEVLGSIAGIDTVFVATTTASQARGLLSLLSAPRRSRS